MHPASRKRREKKKEREEKRSERKEGGAKRANPVRGVNLGLGRAPWPRGPEAQKQ